MSAGEGGRLSQPDRVLRLWKEHRAELVRYARRFVPGGQTELAEELVGALFERLLEGRPKLRSVADPAEEPAKDLASAYRVLRNLGRNLRRKEKIREAEPLEDHAACLGDGTRLWRVLRRAEACAVVREAMENALTPSEREVIKLTLQEYTHKEIAGRRGCAAGTVKALRHRAREKMARYLEETYGADAFGVESDGPADRR